MEILLLSLFVNAIAISCFAATWLYCWFLLTVKTWMRISSSIPWYFSTLTSFINSVTPRSLVKSSVWIMFVAASGEASTRSPLNLIFKNLAIKNNLRLNRSWVGTGSSGRRSEVLQSSDLIKVVRIRFSSTYYNFNNSLQNNYFSYL